MFDYYKIDQSPAGCRAVLQVGLGLVGTANAGFCVAAEPAGGPASSLSSTSAMAARAPASSPPVPPAFQSVGTTEQLTCVSISEGKHVISGHARCHLERSSGFPKWKQHALRVITGRAACSGVRPSIYKRRLPFQPSDRTTQGGHNQSQLTPVVSQQSLHHPWHRDICQDSGPWFPTDSWITLFHVKTSDTEYDSSLIRNGGTLDNHIPFNFMRRLS